MAAGVGFPSVAGSLLAVGLGTEVGVTSLSSSTSYDGTGAFTELTFSNVNLCGCVVGGRAVDSVEVSVVGPVLNLEAGMRRGWLVTKGGRRSACTRRTRKRR